MQAGPSEFLPSDDEPQDAANPAKIRPQRALAGLVLVCTPIGNLGDMSIRAIEVLRTAALILCEDTRMTARLCAAHGIATRLEALHDHNEDSRIPALLDRLAAGQTLALVSDAGTPLLSDPGYRLVRAAIAAAIPVSGMPGANAAVLALILSGLPPYPYLFLGFAPARTTARKTGYATLRAAERAGLSATLIWYEAPHRLAEALADLAAAFGDRPAAVARELTKRFEEVRRGGLFELAAHYAASPARGEICVLVAPAPAELADAGDLDASLRAALAAMSLKDAASAVAIATGLKRKQVYARALELSQLQGSAPALNGTNPQTAKDFEQSAS